MIPYTFYNICIGRQVFIPRCRCVQPTGKFEKPNFLSIENKVEKSGLSSITGLVLIGWRQGFLQVIDLNELWICLADSTHQPITVFELSDFNLSRVLFFKIKCVQCSLQNLLKQGHSACTRYESWKWWTQNCSSHSHLPKSFPFRGIRCRLLAN